MRGYVEAAEAAGIDPGDELRHGEIVEVLVSTVDGGSWERHRVAKDHAAGYPGSRAPVEVYRPGPGPHVIDGEHHYMQRVSRADVRRPEGSE